MKIRRIAAADIRPGMKIRYAGSRHDAWREVANTYRPHFNCGGGRTIGVVYTDGTDGLPFKTAEFEVLEEVPYLLAAIDNRPTAEAAVGPILAAGLLALLGLAATPRIA
ncbi:hypothetical protein [Polymorphospora lycopeni]|uniref:DUF3592 domain-containing protein n=1 Tax=Polymorphospora lycopeni TaxID=3140240 RepID=A0ABV5CKZ6_9ACTN